VLEEDAGGAERRRRFVESFVRPQGLDRPATPILADAVEELADVRVEKPVGAGALLLRVPLAVEAGLSSVVMLLPDLQLGRALRRATRRIRGGARRIGLLRPRSEG
jgi:hypothetical protein